MGLGAFFHSKVFLWISCVTISAAAIVTAVVLTHDSDEYRVIKVDEVKGSATVARTSVNETIDAYKGMNLENGDSVTTFENSNLRMVLDDNKYVLMEPETVVELTATGTAEDSKTKLVLKSGAVLNEITKKLSADSVYEVAAPKATMAVRGTSFRVAVTKDENGDYITKLFVIQGKVTVTLQNEDGSDSGNSVVVSEDHCVTIKTVKKDNSSNDASVDGRSFFVFEQSSGYVEVENGADPVTTFDYKDMPYDTLSEIYYTDKDKKIELFNEIIRKVIAAMEQNAPDQKTTTTTTTTTTTKKTTTTPSDTTTVPEETTTTPSDTTTVTTTTPGTTPSTTTVTTTTTPKKTTTKKTTTTTTTKKTTSTTTTKTVTKYTVIFYDYNGTTVLKTETVESGKAASAPSTVTKNYTKDGVEYRFTGWDKSFSKVTSNLTVKPVYDAYVPVTLYDAIGSNPTDISPSAKQKVGSSYTLPTTSVSDGYSVGWFKCNSDLLISSSSVISSMTVNQSERNNIAVRTRYTNVNFTEMSSGEISNQGTFKILCSFGDSYSIMKSDGTCIPLIEESAGTKIFNTELGWWTFTVNGDSLSFYDLTGMMAESSSPIRITGAKYDPSLSVSG